jgi:hypothetical protein
MSRIFSMSFASVYPISVAKAEKRGRSRDEVDRVIRWVTAFDELARGKAMDKILRA